jgi:SAM-dependent methyltransferase
VSCVEALGGAEDATVLELGPLEGAHSVTLRRLGARHVVAIEANTSAYLRCLVTKEVLRLDGVEFRLGDLRPYLADTTERFDLAVAIGVLYHLDDPVPVLADLARVADRIVIWTHVHNAEFDVDRLAGRFGAPVARSLGTTTYRLHPFSYLESLEWQGFCGGTRPTAAWIERDGLLDVVDALGFDVVLRDDHDHEYGPAITLALRRR